MSGPDCAICGEYFMDCKCEGGAKKEWKKFREKTISNIWSELPYHTRLIVTEFIFRKITERPNCSFRRLIYDRLGFKYDAYAPLYLAGGMEIANNMIQALEEQLNHATSDNHSDP